MKPEELKYNESHEWVGMDGDLAVVGITDFAIEQLTDLVYMALPDIGAKVTRGEEFGEVESVKAVSNLYSPVDGEIVEVHNSLADNMEVLSTDAYGEGWMIKVKLAEGASLDGLLDFEAYKKQCSDS
ncbi:MAG: glycine cleavage system protein GcvH [Planctomycetota bacterium]